jgi:hypothetical protein
MVRKQCPVLELANQMPVRNMDLARAPRRAARKKGSGYENDLKGGFPLGEIFRPNRNFLLSYKHSDGTNQKSFEFEQSKFRFDRKISPNGKPPLITCHTLILL